MSEILLPWTSPPQVPNGPTETGVSSQNLGRQGKARCLGWLLEPSGGL